MKLLLERKLWQIMESTENFILVSYRILDFGETLTIAESAIKPSTIGTFRGLLHKNLFCLVVIILVSNDTIIQKIGKMTSKIIYQSSQMF